MESGAVGLNPITDSLTWEQVFNGDLHPWGDLAAAQSAAKGCSYAYMTYEGLLYTTDRHTGAWSPAAFSANMLAENSAAVVALRERIRNRDVKISELQRCIARRDDEAVKLARRASDLDARCERQGRIIDSLRDAHAARTGGRTSADRRLGG